MKYLSEVTRIVTNFREPMVEIIDENSALASNDAISKLYSGLKNGSIDSDQKAAEVIYGKPIVDTKYTTLKNRLKRRLLNSLFFLNIRPPTFSEYASALYQSNKSVFIMKTLASLGGRNTATKILQSALAHSQKFSLTSNSIEYLLQLRVYSNFLGNEKAYDDYDRQLKIAMKTFEAECLAQEYNDRVTIKFAKSSAEQPEMIETINGYCNDLKSLKQNYDSRNLSYYYYRIQNLYFQISRNYQAAVDTCNDAEEYMSKNPHLFNKNQIAEFSLQKLACYLTLREYVKGKETALKCEELYPKESNPNWFIYMEFYFYLLMHTEHFTEAETVLKSVIEHPRFAFQPEHKKEYWKLFEYYLQFALSVTTSQKMESRIVDPDKFLRIVPQYTKDKRGFNVAILILHILLLLDNNDFGSIIGRMDALRTYRTRYLRAASNKQSALFFRMLQIMETNSFSYQLTKQKSQRYFDKMKSTSAELSEIQDGVQVLPFDWLWNTILEMLKQKEEQKIIQKVMK
jgi:tetratricopeptide (TPR) repeat protein